MGHSEKRPDVMSFANLAAALSGDEEQYTILSKKISPDVQARLTKAREKILKFNYGLQLFYVTTGKASTPLRGSEKINQKY